MTIKSLYPASRPSLDLNFAKLKRLDPRITFTRASTGTYVGSDGLIKSAAVDEARFDHNPATGESLGLLVEEARTNSLVDSSISFVAIQSFIADWRKWQTGTSPTNGVLTNISYEVELNPGGSWRTVKLAPNLGFATNNMYADDGLSNGKVFTGTSAFVSGFFKPSGCDVLVLRWGNYSTSRTFFKFNSSTLSATGTGATIQAVANGWFKFTCGPSSSQAVTFACEKSNGNPFNGVDGVLLWGVQLEEGGFPTSHIPTPTSFTSRASTATYYDSAGVIQTAAINVARSAAFFPDSNGVMRLAGLLLEAAGTNLVINSIPQLNGINNWSLRANTTITLNAAQSPDGTTTASLVKANLGSTDYAYTRHTLASGTASSCVVSTYAKADGLTEWTMESNCPAGQIIYIFNLASNSATLQINGTGQSSVPFIQKLPNGWFRCGFTSPIATTHITLNARPTWSGSQPAADGVSGVLFWGTQIETSPYPTSYIPTSGSTVTRSADVSSSATVTRSVDVAQITGTNFSSWYRQDEGSVLAHSSTQVSSYLAHFYGSSGTQNRIALVRNSSGRGQLVVETNAISQVTITLSGGDSIGVSSKLAAAYKINDFSLAQSSFTGVDTSGTPDPTINKISIGSLTSGASNFANGTISRLTYWPTRLPDATLQALTAS